VLWPKVKAISFDYAIRGSYHKVELARRVGEMPRQLLEATDQYHRYGVARATDTQRTDEQRQVQPHPGTMTGRYGTPDLPHGRVSSSLSFINVTGQLYS